MPDDEAALTAAIVRLASRYGRYGYRRIREMLVAEGWRVNVKRVYRIWRREGLKVPTKQPKRGRLWLNDGSCVRLRPAASKPRLVVRLRPGSHARMVAPSACWSCSTSSRAAALPSS